MNDVAAKLGYDLRVLVLGGTSEASALAQALAARGNTRAILSYAGRVDAPRAQPIPTRIGGFGGVKGLAAFIARERIDRVVDATHPFAARMSANAVAACSMAGTPLVALEREPWKPVEGDDWIDAATLQDAAALLAERFRDASRRVFLAIGRLHLPAFAIAPQHHYVLRLIDAPPLPLPLPNAEVIVARGPFREADDRAMMAGRRIDIVVAKNAGGDASHAKIAAARALGLPVIMIRRPAIPARALVRDVAGVMAWLDDPAAIHAALHAPGSGAPSASERGV